MSVLGRYDNDETERCLCACGYEYRRNAPLSEYCTFKIGGLADFVIMPGGPAELTALVRLLRYDCGTKCVVIGNGSNILFSDDGYRGAVIVTTHMSTVKVDAERGTISACCGASVTSLSVQASKASLTGFEFAYGIPGSVGGAVYMNAGAFGGQISDIIISTQRYDPATETVSRIGKADHGFRYRYSRFQNEDSIILSSDFILSHGGESDIKALMEKNIRHRSEHQPLNYPSAGSVFKRCEGRYTAQMIEEAGLKGKKIGGAQISEKHAGFIVNTGSATADDVLRLTDIVKEELYKRFGVTIEREIRVIR